MESTECEKTERRAKRRREIPRLSYRIDEVAEATGIHRATLYRKLASGELRARKSGKMTLIDAEDLNAFIKGLPAFKPQAQAA